MKCFYANTHYDHLKVKIYEYDSVQERKSHIRKMRKEGWEVKNVKDDYYLRASFEKAAEE